MIAMYRRKRALAAWALANGFKALGKSLPKEIDLSPTDLIWASAFWNVYEGTVRNLRVVIFDCRIGRGKGSWCRTGIAVQTPTDPFRGPVFRSPNVDTAGDWQILYAPRNNDGVHFTSGLMPVDEIGGNLQSIR